MTVDEVTVEQFAEWWLANRQIKPPQDAIRRVGTISGFTLFRAGPFQVEMFIAEPHSSAPPHSHPNVDSVEFVLSGTLVADEANGIILSPGVPFSVPRGAAHVAACGESGVCFLSIQKWIGQEPTSVTIDWDGAPIDAAHGDTLMNRIH